MLAHRKIDRRDADGAVVVCGGGAAGMAAALAAARHGAQVVLIEAAPALGGTVAHALIHTLAGLYDSAGELLQGGLARELSQRLLRADPRARRRKMGRLWVLNVCPNAYQAVVARWIAESGRITVLRGACVTGLARDDDRVVELRACSAERSWRFRPRAVIDATGSAEVVRLLDESFVLDDDHRAAGGWIFRLRGLAPGALEFPRNVAVTRALRDAAAAGLLPSECGQAWIDGGIEEDEAFVKLFVPLANGWRDEACRREISAQARQAQALLVTFLRGIAEFAAIHVTQTGCLGIRDGGRIRGRYTLTVEDVRAGRRFPDAAARCSWPIEYWDPQRGVSLEHLPDGAYYEIPMSSLRLPGIENLWAVGKCLSADRLAHASARVVGACWAMGEAAGHAAASCAAPARLAVGGAP